MSTNEESVQKDYSDGHCAICLAPLTNKSQLLCGHAFCYKCVMEWCRVKMQCPICKQNFNSFVSTDLHRDDMQLNTDDGHSYYYDLCETETTPDTLPVALNIVIDGNSFDITEFLENECEFVHRISLSYQNVLANKKHFLSFTFLNASEDPEYRLALLNAVKKVSADEP